jgi:GH25 family lysozyme M1 (1,4-beta-N-acetylmuramidase)
MEGGAAMALGIDIYRSFQTVTSWPAVQGAGVEFVYVKLSDGGGMPVGGTGDNEVNGAKSVGIPVGGYHFVQASPAPETQADILLGEVERLGATGCVPMLDLEDNPSSSSLPNIPDNQKAAFGTAFCNRVAARGFRPGVYLNNALAKIIRPDTWAVPDLVIWIARYGARPDAAAGRYDIHQYSSSGSISGISARGVDLDWSYTDAYLTSHLTEEDMPDRELLPTDGARTRSVTLIVPKTAAELVITVGWVRMFVSKVALFGPTPDTGTNILQTLDHSADPFPVDAGRPWQIPLQDARGRGDLVSAEITYSMAPAPADKPEVVATAGFR